MRTRRSKKSQEGDSGLDSLLRSLHEDDASARGGDGTAAPDTLADASRHTVDQLLDRVGSKRKKRVGVSSRAIIDLPDGRGSQRNTPKVVCGMRARTTQELESSQRNSEPSTSEPASASLSQPVERQEDNDSHVPCDEDFDWEDGDDGTRIEGADDTIQKGWSGKITFDVDNSPGEESEKRSKKFNLRRANANDKEFAAQVHMAHLLCLLARGRIVSQSSDDSLLQAALVSLLPPRLLPSADADRVTIGRVEHLVSWFKNQFRLLTPDEGPSRLHKEDAEALESRLQEVLQKQCGSAEELAALSVAMFRGLGYICRYVTILDVASIKPDAESLEASVDWDPSAPFCHSRIGPQFQFELRQQVAELSKVLARPGPQVSTNTSSPMGEILAMPSGDTGRRNSGGSTASTPPGERGLDGSGRGGGRGRGRGRGRGKGKNIDDESPLGAGAISKTTPAKKGRRRTKADNNVKQEESPQTVRRNSKRKGDEEFEAQLAMALAATAAAAKAEATQTSPASNGKEESSVKELCWSQRRDSTESNGGKSKLFEFGAKGVSSGSVWSWKMGPVLHWAEIYCGGEGSTGRWVHVDATRGIVDGAAQVEGQTAACRSPLRYVVAFAGAGAKDVTRRYVSLWSSVEPLRVDSEWWESTMLPLKQLEAAATSGPSVILPSSMSSQSTLGKKSEISDKSAGNLPQWTPRADREDMELDTKLFTEPLPTNQQCIGLQNSSHLRAGEVA